MGLSIFMLGDIDTVRSKFCRIKRGERILEGVSDMSTVWGIYHYIYVLYYRFSS